MDLFPEMSVMKTRMDLTQGGGFDLGQRTGWTHGIMLFF